jgi:hypothetical protein
LPKQSHIPRPRAGDSAPLVAHQQRRAAPGPGDDLAARVEYRAHARLLELEHRERDLTAALADAERRAAEVVALRDRAERAERRESDLRATADRERAATELELQRLAAEAAEAAEAAAAHAQASLEIARLEGELRAADQSRQRAEAALAAIVSSRSWRLAAALRALVRRLSRR